MLKIPVPMQEPHAHRWPAALLALVGLAVLTGCRPEPAPTVTAAPAMTTLAAPTVPAAATPAAAAAAPRRVASSHRLIQDQQALERAKIGKESRFVLPSTMQRVSLVAADADVEIHFGVVPELWREGTTAVDFSIVVRADGADDTVFSKRVEPANGAYRWHRAVVSLDRFRGKPVSLLLMAHPIGGNGAGARHVRWSNPRLIAPPTVPRPAGGLPNLVLISLDTVRADHLGAYGHPRPTSPNIDRLAANGVLFRRAISPSGWTLPSHASLFTGVLPLRHGATEFGFHTPIPQRFDTLAERLWDAGYETAGFTDGLFVSISLNFDQGFDVYGDVYGYQHKRRFRDTVRRARSWIEESHPGPFFLFLHSYEAHLPYLPPPEYVRLFDPGYKGMFAAGLTDEWTKDSRQLSATVPDAEIPHIEALYDAGIRSADDAVGELVALLDQHGLTDSTCIVITSDHGEEFREHGNLFHHHATLYDEIVHVPLIISCPGRVAGGRVVDVPVGMIDIMPTLLELAGLPAGSDLDAHSLVPALQGHPPVQRPLLSESDGSLAGRPGATRAVTVGNYRLIESTVPTLPPLQLFDLTADPGEREDRRERNPALLAHLRESFGDAGTTMLAEAAPTPPPLDAAARERLRSLGYGE